MFDFIKILNRKPVIIAIAALFLIAIIYLSLFSSIDMTENDNIMIKNNQINLSLLSIRQKIAQMIVIRGDSKENLLMVDENIGGIFLDRQKTKEDYVNIINVYQNNSKIKLFAATDLEGAWNPFLFYESLYFTEINSSKTAYEIGKEHGEILKEMGFNVNFAPVSEFVDKSYGGGRAFSGSKNEIKKKISSYIKGLQENVFSTCKHYPGKGMINNLHTGIDKQNISLDDLELFQECFKNNVSAVMVGHQVAYGEIDSDGKPSSVSEEVISKIPSDKLVISDEINMLGFSSLYIDKADMYKDLINSGENLILDFELDYVKLSKLLDELEIMAKNDEISQDKIDNSVKKILRMKGYEII